MFVYTSSYPPFAFWVSNSKLGQKLENLIAKLAKRTEALRIELDAQNEQVQKKEKAVTTLADDIVKIKETINKIIKHLNTKNM